MDDMSIGITRRGLVTAGAVAGAGLSAAALAACGGDDSPKSDAGASKPRRGGKLRVANVTGTVPGPLDVLTSLSGFSVYLLPLVYDGVMDVSLDGRIRKGPIEELTSNKDATEWTCRLMDGVEFHNGKTLQADDLIFTARLMLKTELALGQASWTWADPRNVRKLDDRTVRFTLKQPDAVVPDHLLGATIFPSVDFDPAQPVGTGPWRLPGYDKSGRSITVERFANYWGGPPHLDAVEFISFPQPESAFNALLSGQLDAMPVDISQMGIATKRGGFEVQRDKTVGPQSVPIAMLATKAPFTDQRVRLAMKLLIDRKQANAQVFPGESEIANDVWVSQASVEYNKDLPQREQDIEQAKSLLKQAGLENHTFEIATAPMAPGMNEIAQAFAAQANDAGVRVKVGAKDPSTYFTSANRTYPMSTTITVGSFPYVNNVATLAIPSAVTAVTLWDDPQFNALYGDAIRTVDKTKRQDIYNEMQKLQWERDGAIVWSWPNQLVAWSTRFAGFLPETKGTGVLTKFNDVYEV